MQCCNTALDANENLCVHLFTESIVRLVTHNSPTNLNDMKIPGQFQKCVMITSLKLFIYLSSQYNYLNHFVIVVATELINKHQYQMQSFKKELVCAALLCQVLQATSVEKKNVQVEVQSL